MIVKPFITYNIATSPILPNMTASMMEYWLAGNGVFVRAARLGLSACVPASNCAIAGLPAITPYVQLEYPLVPAHLALEMLHQASNCRCLVSTAILHVTRRLSPEKVNAPTRRLSGVC